MEVFRLGIGGEAGVGGGGELPGASGPGPSGMRNFTPVRYGTVFLQNPGIPVFFGTV